MTNLEATYQKWLDLYSVVRSDTDEHFANGFSAPFVAAPVRGPIKSKVILLVGKAVVAPWLGLSNDAVLKEKYELSERIALTQDFMDRQLSEKPINNGAWWKFARDILRRNDDGEIDPERSLVWSNLARISTYPKGAEKNPTGVHWDYQTALIEPTLTLEIATYRPTLVIFTTYDYGEYFVAKTLEHFVDTPPTRFPKEHGYWTAQSTDGKTTFLWIGHPQGLSRHDIDRNVELARAALA